MADGKFRKFVLLTAACAIGLGIEWLLNERKSFFVSKAHPLSLLPILPLQLPQPPPPPPPPPPLPPLPPVPPPLPPPSTLFPSTLLPPPPPPLLVSPSPPDSSSAFSSITTVEHPPASPSLESRPRELRLAAPPPSSPWSYNVNYSKAAHLPWPQCSTRRDNCLVQLKQESGCERWRQAAQYPVLVGDMDGSGSRGITWLLRAGGVWMRTTNEWLDWAKQEHPLSNKIMQATHSADYEAKQLPEAVRRAAHDAVKGALREFANVAQNQLGKWSHRNLKPWEVALDGPDCPRRIGWKHGPLLFLQPIYEQITQGRHTFVHLIRDGRDMAFSRNRNNLAKYPKFGGQVVGLFKLGKSKTFNRCFFRPEQKHTAKSDLECLVMQMRLWERMNLHAAQYAERTLGPRYVPVKIEDFILPSEATRIQTILLFFRRLGVATVTTVDQAAELSRRIFGSASLRSHFSIERWGGCDPALIDRIEAAGKQGLAHFGYETWRVLLQQQQQQQQQQELQQQPPPKPNGCSVGVSQVQVPGGGTGKPARKGGRGSV